MRQLNPFAILIVVAFVLSLPMRWYQNYWMSTRDWDRPPVMRSGYVQMSHIVLTFLFTYGGIIGIFYFFGIWPTVLAFALRWWVGNKSWRVYFNQEVERAAAYYYRQLQKLKDLSSPDGLGIVEKSYLDSLPEDFRSWDESQMRQWSYHKAQNTVREMRLRT